jgi:hypothetical protein
MSNYSTKKRIAELELKLGPEKIEVLGLVLDKQLRPRDPDVLDYGQIADKFGISRMTLHRWRNDDDFIELKNLHAQKFLQDEIPGVHGVLLKAIQGKQPSMKAVEMFYKLFSMLNDKQIVENANDADKRDETSVKETLADIDRLLDEEGGGNNGAN